MSIYLSASSIKDFIRCSQKVKYRFSKEVTEIPSTEMTIGKIVHSIIEKAWNNPSIARQMIEDGIIDNNLSEEAYQRIDKYVEIFFSKFQYLLKDQDPVELNFKIPIFDGIFLVGKIDRIVNSGTIVDWKTGTIRSKKLSNDPQCMIYSFAYNKLYGAPPDNVYLASLSTGELIPYVENQAYVNELFRNIIPKMIKTVKDQSYEKSGMFNGSCFRCPYRVGCLKNGGEDVMDSTVSPE